MSFATWWSIMCTFISNDQNQGFKINLGNLPDTYSEIEIGKMEFLKPKHERKRKNVRNKPYA